MSNIKNEIKIALIGKMRVGKDSVADYAIKKYGFTRFAFGDGIKKVCRELFPDQMKGGKNRQLLQNYGQMMRYEFDENVWVNYCFNEIKNEEAKAKLAYSKLLPIITDLRQPNEYERCRKEGFIIIKIHTEDDIRLERINEKGDNFTLEDLQHETEQHIDTFEYDCIVWNNGKLLDAYSQLDVIMNEINNESNL